MRVSIQQTTFSRYSRVVLLTLLFSACTSQEVVSYRIRPTTTTVHTENLSDRAENLAVQGEDE